MRPLVLLSIATSFLAPTALGQSVYAEETGLEDATPVTVPAPVSLAAAGGTMVLAIPESSSDNVVLLDATSGDLILTAALSASDGLSTPINAILDIDGEGLLICDQVTDGAYRFSAAGAPEGIFAPAAGPNTAILDNVRGCAVENDTLYVTTAGGANADAVARFDATGAFVGNFIEPGGGGLDGPFDILFRASDVLVPSIDTDNILRYDRSGTFLDVFATALPFPEQIQETASGTILVADFTLGQIVEYPASGGTPVGAYSFTGLSGFRGVYELPSGDLIVTNGGGIHQVRRDGTFLRTIVAGVSARFVEVVPAGFVVAGTPAAPTDAASLRLAGPNPSPGGTTLELRVPTAQHITAALYDATGRQLAVLHDGIVGSGTTQMLTLRAMGLAPGVYVVRALGETFSLAQPVAVVR